MTIRLRQKNGWSRPRYACSQGRKQGRFTLGDMCLFRAFVEIGPRLSLLLMSLNAPLSAILGWLWLGEHYGPVQWLGMAVTLWGVGWVILERPPGEFVIRWWKPTFRALRDARAMMWLTIGAFLGPFLGVWLYLRAMQLTTVGVVATIIALLPVAIIPLSIAFRREHISRRSVAGALIAFVGVALIQPSAASRTNHPGQFQPE